MGDMTANSCVIEGGLESLRGSLQSGMITTDEIDKVIKLERERRQFLTTESSGLKEQLRNMSSQFQKIQERIATIDSSACIEIENMHLNMVQLLNTIDNVASVVATGNDISSMIVEARTPVERSFDEVEDQRTAGSECSSIHDSTNFNQNNVDDTLGKAYTSDILELGSIANTLDTAEAPELLENKPDRGGRKSSLRGKKIPKKLEPREESLSPKNTLTRKSSKAVHISPSPSPNPSPNRRQSAAATPLASRQSSALFPRPFSAPISTPISSPISDSEGEEISLKNVKPKRNNSPLRALMLPTNTKDVSIAQNSSNYNAIPQRRSHPSNSINSAYFNPTNIVFEKDKKDEISAQDFENVTLESIGNNFNSNNANSTNKSNKEYNNEDYNDHVSIDSCRLDTPKISHNFDLNVSPTASPCLSPYVKKSKQFFSDYDGDENIINSADNRDDSKAIFAQLLELQEKENNLNEKERELLSLENILCERENVLHENEISYSEKFKLFEMKVESTRTDGQIYDRRGRSLIQVQAYSDTEEEESPRKSSRSPITPVTPVTPITPVSPVSPSPPTPLSAPLPTQPHVRRRQPSLESIARERLIAELCAQEERERTMENEVDEKNENDIRHMEEEADKYDQKEDKRAIVEQKREQEQDQKYDEKDSNIGITIVINTDNTTHISPTKLKTFKDKLQTEIALSADTRRGSDSVRTRSDTVRFPERGNLEVAGRTLPLTVGKRSRPVTPTFISAPQRRSSHPPKRHSVGSIGSNSGVGGGGYGGGVVCVGGAGYGGSNIGGETPGYADDLNLGSKDENERRRSQDENERNYASEYKYDNKYEDIYEHKDEDDNKDNDKCNNDNNDNKNKSDDINRIDDKLCPMDDSNITMNITYVDDDNYDSSNNSLNDNIPTTSKSQQFNYKKRMKKKKSMLLNNQNNQSNQNNQNNQNNHNNQNNQNYDYMRELEDPLLYIPDTIRLFIDQETSTIDLIQWGNENTEESTEERKRNLSIFESLMDRNIPQMEMENIPETDDMPAKNILEFKKVPKNFSESKIDFSDFLSHLRASDNPLMLLYQEFHKYLPERQDRRFLRCASTAEKVKGGEHIEDGGRGGRGSNGEEGEEDVFLTHYDEIEKISKKLKKFYHDLIICEKIAGDFKVLSGSRVNMSEDQMGSYDQSTYMLLSKFESFESQLSRTESEVDDLRQIFKEIKKKKAEYYFLPAQREIFENCLLGLTKCQKKIMELKSRSADLEASCNVQKLLYRKVKGTPFVKNIDIQKLLEKEGREGREEKEGREGMEGGDGKGGRKGGEGSNDKDDFDEDNDSKGRRTVKVLKICKTLMSIPIITPRPILTELPHDSSHGFLPPNSNPTSPKFLYRQQGSNQGGNNKGDVKSNSQDYTHYELNDSLVSSKHPSIIVHNQGDNQDYDVDGGDFEGGKEKEGSKEGEREGGEGEEGEGDNFLSFGMLDMKQLSAKLSNQIANNTNNNTNNNSHTNTNSNTNFHNNTLRVVTDNNGVDNKVFQSSDSNYYQDNKSNVLRNLSHPSSSIDEYERYKMKKEESRSKIRQISFSNSSSNTPHTQHSQNTPHSTHTPHSQNAPYTLYTQHSQHSSRTLHTQNTQNSTLTPPHTLRGRERFYPAISPLKISPQGFSPRVYSPHTRPSDASPRPHSSSRPHSSDNLPQTHPPDSNTPRVRPSEYTPQHTPHGRPSDYSPLGIAGTSEGGVSVMEESLGQGLEEHLRHKLKEAEEEIEHLNAEIFVRYSVKDTTPGALLFFSSLHDINFISNLQQLMLQMKKLQCIADGSEVHVDFTILRKRLSVCASSAPSLAAFTSRYISLHKKWMTHRHHFFESNNATAGLERDPNICPLCYNEISDLTMQHFPPPLGGNGNGNTPKNGTNSGAFTGNTGNNGGGSNNNLNDGNNGNGTGGNPSGSSYRNVPQYNSSGNISTGNVPNSNISPKNIPRPNSPGKERSDGASIVNYPIQKPTVYIPSVDQSSQNPVRKIKSPMGRH